MFLSLEQVQVGLQQKISILNHVDLLVVDRTFTSEAVEKVIKKVKNGIKNPELSWMFENCFPNTLDTTVDFEYIDGKPDAYIITGDIDAMWLRDSTAQIWPYLPINKGG